MISLDRVGEISINTQGCEMEIIEYNHGRDCTIQFCNTNTILFKKYYRDFILGLIRDPYFPLIHSIGFIGIGIYSNKAHRRIYHIWSNMIGRGYCLKVKKKQPTYEDTTVCEEWHNFQNFAKWYDDNWKPYMEGWQLDKDILIRGNKKYSPATCSLVPKEINYLLLKADKIRGSLPIGVNISLKKYSAYLTKNNIPTYLGTFTTIGEAFQAYKAAKEAHIKEVANEWKSLIKPNVYEALYNYQVEITD